MKKMGWGWTLLLPVLVMGCGDGDGNGGTRPEDDFTLESLVPDAGPPGTIVTAVAAVPEGAESIRIDFGGGMSG